MKMRTRHFALSFTLVLLALAATGRAQTIQNGSFENPALSGTTAPGSGANWTTTGNATVYTNGVGFGSTTYGTQWEGLAASGATDAQTISGTFVLNQLYILSLVSSDVSGNAGDQLTVTISGGATASRTFALPTRSGGFNSGALPFVTYSLPFTPTSSAAVTVTLSAANATFAGDTIAIDNVQLVVPEPSTWAMLGLGAAGVGVVALRRRQVRAA